jgi:glutathione synthase/RimK-type ligase-like ATP-grasp enzyme
MPTRKALIMYFRKKKRGKDPFATFGVKRSVYYYFFKLGSQLGFDMLIASGKDGHLENLQFKNLLRYRDGSFSKKSGEIQATAVLDRSGGLSFPPKAIGKRILNCLEFKKLCCDKNLTYAAIGKFMPQNFEISNKKELRKYLKKFNPTSLAVLKPARGMCGKDILIQKPDELSAAKLIPGKKYVLQEFIDTSDGISGITKGRHDLRIIIVEGRPVLAHVRTPKKGNLLANVAQGGKIKEIPLKKIPAQVLKTAKNIQKIIDKKYFYPLYSIDFGLDKKGKPFVFELNDQIGFPREDMPGAKNFIEALVLSLRKRAG